MQLTATLSFLLYAASIAVAVPVERRASGTSYNGGTTANDVKNGVCAPVTLSTSSYNAWYFAPSLIAI